MGNLLRTASITSMILAIISSLLYYAYDITVFFILLLVFCTLFYHLMFRDIGGVLFDKLLKNQVNYKKFWFQPHKWEKPLYKLFGVKNWKKHMPTFDPSLFSMEKHTFEEILMASCQAELVHETNMLLSILPILIFVWSSNLGIKLFFIISSICAALIDSLFVMIQRFNRPRMLKMTLLEKNRKQKEESVK